MYPNIKFYRQLQYLISLLNPKSLRMDILYHKTIAESKILHTFNGFCLFQYKQRHKKLVAEGNCLLLQSAQTQAQEPTIHIKMNNFEYIKKINNNLFIRVRYQNTTAILFFHQSNQNLVYAITSNNKSQYLSILENLLIQKAQLVQYQQSALKYEDKLRIDYHCDKIKQNEVSVHYNTAARIGKAVGNIFGFIGIKVTKAGSKFDDSFNKKVQTFSRESLSSETRSKWSSFKQKASEFNEKLTQLIKPLGDLGNRAVNKLGDSYQKSDNLVIRSIRQLTKQTQNSLNQGYIAQIQQQKKVEDTLNQTFQPMKQSQKVLYANEQSS